jgi:hypothetical protein
MILTCFLDAYEDPFNDSLKFFHYPVEILISWHRNEFLDCICVHIHMFLLWNMFFISKIQWNIMWIFCKNILSSLFRLSLFLSIRLLNFLWILG